MAAEIWSMTEVWSMREHDGMTEWSFWTNFCPFTTPPKQHTKTKF